MKTTAIITVISFLILTAIIVLIRSVSTDNYNPEKPGYKELSEYQKGKTNEYKEMPGDLKGKTNEYKKMPGNPAGKTTEYKELSGNDEYTEKGGITNYR